MKSKKIDIILPSRIGDSILSIPVIACLAQLSEKYDDGLKIKVLAKPFLVELFSSLKLFECRGMNNLQKLQSVFFPADKAFFVETTNNNLGYCSKESYGTASEFKKLLKFTHSPIFHYFSYSPFPQTWEKIKNTFPEGLSDFLLEKCGYGWYSAALFGICLEMGYTKEQIMETYEGLKPDYSAFKDLNSVQGDYIVFCAEAGYGRKHLNERCWDINGYFQIAEKCYRDYGLKSVFVGVNAKTELPENEYIVDLRGKLNLYELACVMRSAKCYVGNDTGPMHVANLMETKTVAVYFKEEHMAGFSPVFAAINTMVYRPESIKPIYSGLEKVLSSVTQKSLLAQSSV